jgi:hypothetical protein
LVRAVPLPRHQSACPAARAVIDHPAGATRRARLTLLA